LEDLFDSPEQKKEEFILHISPLGNNLNFLCPAGGLDCGGMNDGTTNA
jgi:hypothetical protein